MLTLKNYLFAALILVIIAITSLVSAASKNNNNKMQEVEHILRSVLSHQQQFHQINQHNRKTFEDGSTTHNKKRVGAPQFYPACQSVTTLGYPCENHEIMTEDGFVLGAIRIPPKQTGAYPVFLFHGLIDSSSTWTMNAHGYQNLGTILHEEGYDVWLQNSRGNHYSFDNVNYPAQDSPEYFRMIDWTWMAKYDVPAAIKYALNYTNKKSLSICGHSQGTTQQFAHFSSSATDPAVKALADSVDVFIALAPVAWVKNSPSLLLRFLAGIDVGSLLKLLGEKFFLTDDALLDLVSRVCPDVGDLCQDILMPLVGKFNPNDINASQLHENLHYTPGGTSVQNMIHWQQAVDDHNGCGFCGHDYGAEINQQLYNSSKAPAYNLSNYAAPKVVLFTGPNDDLADPKDVELLIAGLNNGHQPIVNTIPIDGYAHMDFVWGLSANKVLYPQILSYIKKFQRNN